MYLGWSNYSQHVLRPLVPFSSWCLNQVLGLKFEFQLVCYFIVIDNFMLNVVFVREELMHRNHTQPPCFIPAARWGSNLKVEKNESGATPCMLDVNLATPYRES